MRRNKGMAGFLATFTVAVLLGGSAYADAPGEVQLNGPIDAVVTAAPASITVSGVTVAVDATTVIVDQNDAPIAFTDPPFSVGATVSVEAVQPAGGGMLATKIQLEDGMQLEDVDLRGAIETIATTSFTVAGIVVTVDAATVIIGTADQPATFADLAIGQIVEVQGNTQLDGSLLATRVKIEDATDVGDVDVLARIDGLGDTFMVEVDRRFVVTPTTDFFGRRDQRISIAELHLGDLADIQGIVRAGGALVAQKVRANVTAAAGIHVGGVIKARTATSITVKGNVYLVPRGTEITNLAGTRLSFAALKVGRMVRIEYIMVGTKRVAREIVAL